jgi:hypothetical protein
MEIFIFVRGGTGAAKPAFYHLLLAFCIEYSFRIWKGWAVTYALIVRKNCLVSEVPTASQIGLAFYFSVAGTASSILDARGSRRGGYT